MIQVGLHIPKMLHTLNYTFRNSINARPFGCLIQFCLSSEHLPCYCVVPECSYLTKIYIGLLYSLSNWSYSFVIMKKKNLNIVSYYFQPYGKKKTLLYYYTVFNNAVICNWIIILLYINNFTYTDRTRIYSLVNVVRGFRTSVENDCLSVYAHYITQCDLGN